jgi:hypothetical protein
MTWHEQYLPGLSILKPRFLSLMASYDVDYSITSNIAISAGPWPRGSVRGPEPLLHEHGHALQVGQWIG